MAEECIRKVSEEIKKLYSLYEKRSDDEYTAFFVLYRLCDIHYDIKNVYRDFYWISEFWENGTLDEMIEICDTTIQKTTHHFFEIMKREKVRYAEEPNSYWCVKFTSVNEIYDGKLADIPELEKINENLEALGMGKILSLAEEQLTEIKTYLGKFGGMRHFLEYGLRSSDITIDEDGLSYIDRDYVEVVEHINFLLKEEEGAVNNVCEMDFNKRKRKNLILEGKDALGTLKEMQNEVAKNLMDYEYLKDIFLEYIDEATLNFNLYSLFVKLYICNDRTKQLFLEKCIRYKWCRDKIAELNKEDEKASLESHEPGPVHETEEEMETMVQGSNDDVTEETIAAVMACFRQNGNENINKREEALKFIRQVKERTPKEVGVLIGELVEQKLLSDVECHIHLWEPLHDAGFYEEGVKNWNKHIKNNL